VLEPGTRLVDRYLLEQHLLGAPGTTYWRAHDEILDRPVGLCLLPAGEEVAPRVLDAARRAAALADARFLRVLDASETDGVVYVVSEWVNATPLVELLAEGPLPPGEARELALDVSTALAAAHRAGLAHLCLQPEHVLRTAHGQVKVVGLGVDAAVRGIEVDDPAAAAAMDTRAAGGITYAALTGRWPGEEATGLPPAPRDGAAACHPRQVRAGIPDDLDDVVCRALGMPVGAGPPLTTPDQLAAALTDAHLTTRIPVVNVERPGRTEYTPPEGTPYEEHPRPGRSRAALAAWTVVSLVLLVGFVLAGGQLAVFDGGDPAEGSPQGAATNAAAGPTGEPVEIVDVVSFDPPPEGTGEENGERAPLAADGDRTTGWTTKSYNDPFGPVGLKDGVGIVLDLGSVHRVSQVTVWVEGATDLEVRTSTEAGTTLDDFTRLDAARDVVPRAVLMPDKPPRAQYVLVWITSAPRAEDGRYRGEIREVTVRG
jgi:hypothetical protein